MRHNFSISFYLKQSTPRKNGKYPIMLRITINKDCCFTTVLGQTQKANRKDRS